MFKVVKFHKRVRNSFEVFPNYVVNEGELENYQVRHHKAILFYFLLGL